MAAWHVGEGQSAWTGPSLDVAFVHIHSVGLYLEACGEC